MVSWHVQQDPTLHYWLVFQDRWENMLFTIGFRPDSLQVYKRDCFVYHFVSQNMPFIIVYSPSPAPPETRWMFNKRVRTVYWNIMFLIQVQKCKKCLCKETENVLNVWTVTSFILTFWPTFISHTIYGACAHVRVLLCLYLHSASIWQETWAIPWNKSPNVNVLTLCVLTSELVDVELKLFLVSHHLAQRMRLFLAGFCYLLRHVFSKESHISERLFY